jgi:glycosyltransferase involved in cell wall biosynthesis
MKILVHIHGYPPNHNAGAEWMVHHMIKWLQKKGHQVLVAVPDPGADEFEGVKIIPEYARRHIRHHYKWADIIMSHLDRCGKVINNIRVVDKPALFVMHNTHRYHHIETIAHRSALCFNSEYTRSVPWYDHKDSCVVYPPCPVDYYKTKRGGGRKITLINHCEKKGAKMFFELAKLLPEYEFMAVKGDYYHQEKQRLENVVFKENTPHIQKEYQITKILLMPSEYESFGRTAIEAAASGIPTVAAPTPGLKESLGDAGIFCDLRNIEVWVKAIKDLMEDKDYYKERSQAVKKRAKELEGLFDEQMVELCELMDRAINRKIKNTRQ